MVEPCTCCDVDPLNIFNVAILTRFKQLGDENVEKQKQFVSDLLSAPRDGDCYERCFEISDGKYLCRTGLSTVLQLSRRLQQKIVPSARHITHRYRIICIASIFSALVVYRTSLLQKRPSRRDRTHEKKNIQWTHPCFIAAGKKVTCMSTYRKHGIKQFASQMGIIAFIKSEQIILGAIGDSLLEKFVTSVNGCVINLSSCPRFHIVLDELCEIVTNFPASEWKRVLKISMAHLEGRPIEYTSSPHASLAMWMISHAKYGKRSSDPQQLNNFLTIVNSFEKHITTTISNFVHKSDAHVVRLQPGALRSKPGTVPQRAHRDFTRKTYHDKLPGQLFIGFMPITRDGMFLQVWNGPGEAKLVFIPYGNFLLLPGNTIHAGWMCTSISNYNYRIHFYIIVSKEPNKLTRKEDLFFENMNTYLNEESCDKEELYKTHRNCLSNCKYLYGL